MTQFKTSANRCHTPKQFRDLLNRLQDVLPYRRLTCAWGYLPHCEIGFIFTPSGPTDFLRWFLTKGMLPKSPLFQEWLRSKRVQVWTDVASRYADRFEPGHRERVIESQLQHSLGSGWLDKELWVFFAITMASEETCRASVKALRLLSPCLCRALRRACPRPLLTPREAAVLERRVMGQAIKHIAAEESIAQRTVTMHLQQIKKKLYTDDLVNAIVMAVKSGMLGQSSKVWRVRR